MLGLTLAIFTVLAVATPDSTIEPITVYTHPSSIVVERDSLSSRTHSTWEGTFILTGKSRIRVEGQRDLYVLSYAHEGTEGSLIDLAQATRDGHLRIICQADTAVFIHGKRIDQQTYERQRDRLREQVGLAEIDLAEATGEELDIDAVLAFAQHVLTNAAHMWEQASFDQKLRLQRALFPDGLSHDGSEFGTAVTCLAFTQLPASATVENGLASPTGFEHEPPEPVDADGHEGNEDT